MSPTAGPEKAQVFWGVAQGVAMTSFGKPGAWTHALSEARL